MTTELFPVDQSVLLAVHRPNGTRVVEEGFREVADLVERALEVFAELESKDKTITTEQPTPRRSIIYEAIPVLQLLRLVELGAMTINELRAELGLPPVTGGDIATVQTHAGPAPVYDLPEYFRQKLA